MSNEVWQDIKGYEGLYQVSNMGHVRSLDWNHTGKIRNLYLKPHNQGYLQVELHKNGTRKMFTVHRLVALHFVQGYQEDFVVNHINEIKTDNRAENLEWCSQSENTKYSMIPGKRRTTKNPRKRKAFKCFSPVIQLGLDGSEIRQWESPVAIKHSLGFSDWSIKQCCLGKRKQAYGYMWQYAT